MPASDEILGPLLNWRRREILSAKEPAKAASLALRMLAVEAPSYLVLAIWTDWKRRNQPSLVNLHSKGKFDTACEMVNEAIAAARLKERVWREALDAAGSIQRPPVLELTPTSRRDWIDDVRVPRGDLAAYAVAAVHVDEAWQSCGADIARSIRRGASVDPPWWKGRRRNTKPGSLDFGVPPDVSERRLREALGRGEGGVLRRVFDYLAAAPLLLAPDRIEMEEATRRFLMASEVTKGFWDEQLTDAPLILAQRLFDSACRREGRPPQNEVVMAICSEVRAVATGSYLETVEDCIRDAQAELTVVVDVAARAWLKRFRVSAEEYSGLARRTSHGHLVMARVERIRDRLVEIWHVVAG